MAEDQAAVADEIEGLEEGAEQAGEPRKKGGMLKWIIILVVLLAAGGGAAWFFLLSPEEAPAEGAAAGEVKASSKPNYFEMNPGFVVNLDDPDLMRYLQVDIQLMAYDSGVLNEVEHFMPEIRNRLLLLLAQQKFEELVTREGKEKLQTTALNEVNAVLKENGIKDKVNALYFTSFVMQ